MSCSMSGVPRMMEMYKRKRYETGRKRHMRPTATNTPSGSAPMSVTKNNCSVTKKPSPSIASIVVNSMI